MAYAIPRALRLPPHAASVLAGCLPGGRRSRGAERCTVTKATNHGSMRSMIGCRMRSLVIVVSRLQVSGGRACGATRRRQLAAMAREVDDRLGRELKLEKDALRVIQRSAPLLAERGVEVEVEGEMDLAPLLIALLLPSCLILDSGFLRRRSGGVYETST